MDIFILTLTIGFLAGFISAEMHRSSLGSHLPALFPNPMTGIIATLGVDKVSDTRDRVDDFQCANVIPPVAQNGNNRSSATDGHATCHKVYATSAVPKTDPGVLWPGEYHRLNVLSDGDRVFLMMKSRDRAAWSMAALGDLASAQFSRRTWNQVSTTRPRQPINAGDSHRPVRARVKKQQTCLRPMRYIGRFPVSVSVFAGYLMADSSAIIKGKQALIVYRSSGRSRRGRLS